MHDAGGAAGGLHILVVDDNHDCATSLSSLLEMMGHSIAIAHDGLAAVRAASQACFDVVLLDLGLPVMDGFQAGAALARMSPAPVLIACSAWDGPDVRQRTAELGFFAHVAKPMHWEALDAALRRVRRSCTAA